MNKTKYGLCLCNRGAYENMDVLGAFGNIIKEVTLKISTIAFSKTPLIMIFNRPGVAGAVLQTPS